MATSTYIDTVSGGLDSTVRRALKMAFEYVLKNLRFGRPGPLMPTENFQASFVEGTTHAVANTEFSVLHGRDTAPYLAIPVLDLQTAGSRIVPLAVTRPADAQRIYLTSSEASRPFTLFIEG